jgi:hypothetical protein
MTTPMERSHAMGFVIVALLIGLALAVLGCEVDEGLGDALDDTSSDVSAEVGADVVTPDGAGELISDSTIDTEAIDTEAIDAEEEIADVLEIQEEPCPADYMGADGTPCQKLGQVCGGDCEGPCQFCNALICEESGWVWMEAFPDPACQCPSEPLSAEGERCVTEGQICSEPCADPCVGCETLLYLAKTGT